MHEIRDAAARKIQRLASPCLACGKQKIEHNDGHTYALIASEIAVPESADLEFFCKPWKEHRWTELNQIQRFDGSKNAALVYAIRCSMGIKVIAVRDPVELFDAGSVLGLVVLNDQETSQIQRLPLTFVEI